ncbi:hypothetical protein [Aureivirga sp. CE67]|uniref:hypothetical protein n=1 Tax=Aureivirga sp. CE67 TaxID=1788983 RepID=UPI0018C98799|nr:hypothetical protein [Aureivirga sp. CE67]
MQVQFSYHQETIEYNCSQVFFSSKKTKILKYLQANFILSDDEKIMLKTLGNFLCDYPIVTTKVYNGPKKLFGSKLKFENKNVILADVLADMKLNTLCENVNDLFENRKKIEDNLKVINKKLKVLVSIHNKEILNLAG